MQSALANGLRTKFWKGYTMKGIYSPVGLLVLIIVQSSWQIPLQETDDRSSFLTEDSVLNEPRELTNVKRHSQGTFTNDYSKYLETRRAQDFVQWLMNSKRNGSPTRRHADGTYTSDFSSYLQDQAAKEFVSWLKTGQGRREFLQKYYGHDAVYRRHVDGSFTSDLHNVLDSIAAKEYILWVMNSKPSDAR
ncbi:glucagon-2-like [Arapaima gigas]